MSRRVAILAMALILAGATAQAMAGQHEAAERAVRARDYARAAHIYHSLARSGDGEAAYRLAGLYRAGRGVARNPELAEQWMERAVAAGYRSAVERASLLRPSRTPESRPTRPADALSGAVDAGDLQAALAAIQAGADPNRVDAQGRCPAGEAIRSANSKLLRLLLANGARPSGCGPGTAGLLHLAVSLDSPEGVRLLASAGAALDERGPGKTTPLHSAARFGHTEVVSALIRSGASLKARDSAGRNALDIALVAGHQRLAKNLRAAGARPARGAPAKRAPVAGEWLTSAADELNQGAYRDWPLLSVASWRGQTQLVRELLARSQDVDALDPEGWSPLARAAGGGHREIMRALLAAGASPSAGQPAPLVASIAADDADLTRMLLEAGAPIAKRSSDERTALHHAAARGGPALIDLLLAHQADANAHDAQQATPLEVAARKGRTDVVALLARHSDGPAREHALCLAVAAGDTDSSLALLDAGAPAAASCQGEPLLHAAARSGAADVVQRLLAAGARDDRFDGSDSSALLLAAERGHADVIGALLVRGSKIDGRGADGRTALMRAAASGHLAAVRRLLDARADHRMRDPHGNTALELARNAGHEDVATSLDSTASKGWFR